MFGVKCVCFGLDAAAVHGFLFPIAQRLHPICVVLQFPFPLWVWLVVVSLLILWMMLGLHALAILLFVMRLGLPFQVLGMLLALWLGPDILFALLLMVFLNSIHPFPCALQQTRVIFAQAERFDQRAHGRQPLALIIVIVLRAHRSNVGAAERSQCRMGFHSTPTHSPALSHPDNYFMRTFYCCLLRGH
jgi:hypothetical protein